MSQPADPFEPLRRAFEAMPIVATLRMRIVRIEAGRVDLEMPIHPGLCFRPGQVQATPLFAIADFAAVGAAATLLPPGWTNRTVDTTLKLIRPATGTAIQATGSVVRAGRLLSICTADVFAIEAGETLHCATLLATARNVDPAEGRPLRAGRRVDA